MALTTPALGQASARPLNPVPFVESPLYFAAKSTRQPVPSSGRDGNVMRGVFLQSITGGYDRASTGDTITGYSADTFGSDGLSDHQQYIPDDAAGYVDVFLISTGVGGQQFEITEDATDQAGSLAQYAIDQSVDISAVFVDIANGTDRGTDESNKFVVAVPQALQFADSSSASTSTGQLRLVGLKQDPGNNTAPYIYIAVVVNA